MMISSVQIRPVRMALLGHSDHLRSNRPSMLMGIQSSTGDAFVQTQHRGRTDIDKDVAITEMRSGTSEKNQSAAAPFRRAGSTGESSSHRAYPSTDQTGRRRTLGSGVDAVLQPQWSIATLLMTYQGLESGHPSETVLASGKVLTVLEQAARKQDVIV